jgi:hypothetical protein
MIAHEPYRSPNDFASLTEIEDRLRRFHDHNERAATPFQSTFIGGSAECRRRARFVTGKDVTAVTP